MTFQEAKTVNCTVLYPTQQLLDISPFRRLDFELLQLNLNPDYGEVLKLELIPGIALEPDTRFVLTSRTVQKIADLAGVVFDHRTSGPLGGRIGSPVWGYRSTGAIKLHDGAWRTYTVRVKFEIPKFKENFKKYLGDRARSGSFYIPSVQGREYLGLSSPKCEREIERCSNILSAHVSSNLAEIVEAEARNKVLRAFFDLKTSYSREELANPLAVPRLVRLEPGEGNRGELDRYRLDSIVSELFRAGGLDVQSLSADHLGGRIGDVTFLMGADDSNMYASYFDTSSWGKEYRQRIELLTRSVC